MTSLITCIFLFYFHVFGWIVKIIAGKRNEVQNYHKFLLNLGFGVYTYKEDSLIMHYDGEWRNGQKSGAGKGT